MAQMMSDAEWGLYDWASVSSISVLFSNDPKRGRGLSSAFSAEAGSSLLTVPWSKVLTLKKFHAAMEAAESKGLGILPNGVPAAIFETCSERHRFCLSAALFYLTEMRNPGSPWAPYLRLLPAPEGGHAPRWANLTGGEDTGVTDLLLSLSAGASVAESGLASVADSGLRAEVEGEDLWLRKVYSLLFQVDFRTSGLSPASHGCRFPGCKLKSPPTSTCDVCPDHRLPLVAWDSFRWTWVLARSRVMELDVEGGGMALVILPFVDMANHDSEPNASISASREGVTLTASRAISEGEPVLISYGTSELNTLARTFGFVPDEFVLKLPLARGGGGGGRPWWRSALRGRAHAPSRTWRGWLWLRPLSTWSPCFLRLGGRRRVKGRR